MKVRFWTTPDQVMAPAAPPKAWMTVATILTLVCLSAVWPAAQASTVEGAALAWKHHCVTCHGQTGIANSDRYPNLAGQNVPYLVSRLKYFRERVEPGNQMNGQAAPLTDEEIQILAEYFNQPE